MPELATEYEKQSDVKLSVTYGSSGNFFAQIQNGALFDLFFSADSAFPSKLAAAHLADADSLQIYAVGRLVLWLPADSSLDPAGGLKILLDSRVRKIAIANPEHAPYGRAALEVLDHAGLYDRVKAKLVLGENISQAAQFAQSGSAQAGLIALSLALSPTMASGKRWVPPVGQQPELEQAAVVLTSSSNKKTALDFLAFLKAPKARAIFERYGFQLPPPHAPARHKL